MRLRVVRARVHAAARRWDTFGNSVVLRGWERVRVRLPLSAMKILPPARPVSTPLYHLLLLGEERGDTADRSSFLFSRFNLLDGTGRRFRKDGLSEG